MTARLNTFIEQVKSGEPIDFPDTIAMISATYDYSPTRFSNGVGEDILINEPGTNEGSCKIFSFARLQGLNEPETLALFGGYFRDVLDHPDGKDHQNIRHFIRHGWMGIHFDGVALSPRAAEKAE